MPRDAIVIHPDFDAKWPFAADDLAQAWRTEIGPVNFIRLSIADKRKLGEILDEPARVDRLVSMDVPLTTACVRSMTSLRQASFNRKGQLPADVEAALRDADVRVVRHLDKSYWSESVAELAVGLVIASLRDIVGRHRAIVAGDRAVWDYRPPEGRSRPDARGEQFADDPRFVNGTVSGKRVRIVGAGNIASRFAALCRALGADVAAFDPFAAGPAFQLSGARRVHDLSLLMRDADIFAPLVPMTDSTRGLVAAEHIDGLRAGSLVVLATRAGVCDMSRLRERVINGELALAADVFDTEPLPTTDPLLGCPNVVLTPHIAGRTRDANRTWAQQLLSFYQI